jgi:hypothetical protein
MRYLALVCVVCALLTAGCHGSTTSPDPIVTATPTTVYYSGTMDVSGGIFWAFTVSQAGTASVTLESLTPGTTISTTNPPLPAVAMGLQFGVASSDGSTCTIDPTLSKTVLPSFSAQLTTQAVAGQTCVQLVDIGNLTGPVSFVVRVVHT